MLKPCYLCNRPNAQRPLSLKDSFTAHQFCRGKGSDKMCDRCYHLLEGKYQFGQYKGKTIYSRNTSWILANPENLEDPRNKPYFGQKVGEKGGKEVRELINLPTRLDLREALINPPEPPFEIAVAESGQKHILYQAETALSRERFGVVFEEGRVDLERDKFLSALELVERILRIGVTKTELLSGEYKGQTLFKYHQELLPLERTISRDFRGTRLFQLIMHVAQSPERTSK